MDIERLYRDYGIPYSTASTSSNVGAEWIGTRCPYCDDPSDHLGAHRETGTFRCWRCGTHPKRKTVAKLISVTESEAGQILARYGAKRPRRRATQREANAAIHTRAHQLPSGTGKLGKNHRRYLERRGFDPDYLERVWGVRGTGPVAWLDGSDYKHRILAPIHWNWKPISWQTRTISKRDPVKYKACPQEREIVHHKSILYGCPGTEWGSMGVAVEGVTDCWRLGPSAFAVLGIEYTQRQVNAIARQFERVVIVFDDEPQARTQARKLAGTLDALKVDVGVIKLEGDPGSLSDQEARKLVREIKRRG